MEIKFDPNVQTVLEFMQGTIPASKLISVAESLPTMARLLWAQFPQEPCVAASLYLPKMDLPSLSRADASESILG